MFGIGFGELVVILVIAMIVVGPERMPELARKIGSTVRDFRRMYDNLRSELGTDFDEIESTIRSIRTLDPRRELDTYGRKLIGDMAQEIGPDAEALLHKSPTQISEQLSGSIKQAIALNPPQGVVSTTDDPETLPAIAQTETPVAQTETLASVEQTQSVPILEQTQTSASEIQSTVDTEILGLPTPEILAPRKRRARIYDIATPEPLLVQESAAPRQRRARIYDIEDPAPAPVKKSVADVIQLSHDLLSDTILDRPLKEMRVETSHNGHELA